MSSDAHFKISQVFTGRPKEIEMGVNILVIKETWGM